MANLYSGIVCLFFALFIALFAWLNIISGVIVCSIILGFYLCLIADEVFSERLKEDSSKEFTEHYD